jgi:hypothetical protein
MYDNTGGAQNSAYGIYALHGNGKGDYNAAVGGYAMHSNTSGSSNIALGQGRLLPYGRGKQYSYRKSWRCGRYRLHQDRHPRHTGSNFIAGITGVVPPGTLAAVYVNSNGQLGVGPPPAESVKADISPMMLLNELKQQAAEIRQLRAEVQALQAPQHN